MVSFLVEYKGFRATIGFDQKDKRYVGHVVGLQEAVNFQGKSIDKAEKEFHNAIENYLEVSKG